MAKHIAAKVARLSAPPPNLALSDWADSYRYLSSEASAEPGRWRTDRAPYQRGILDAVSDRNTHTVVAMCSSQVGKTEIINNAAGYFAQQDPAPILLVMPTLDMAESWSKDRFTPMVRDTPILSEIINVSKKRDGENTILHKKFPGGHLTIAGSNSPASLASRPIRILLLDEVDRYNSSAGTEGDPVSLAMKRTVTFWNRKVVMVSSPGIKGESKIEAHYHESDMRRYHVPCPHCDEGIVLQWQDINWPAGRPEEAHYICPHCGSVLTDDDKPLMLKHGKWIANAEFNGIAGFHLSELYSPWVRWGAMAERFVEDKKLPDKLKVFVNTSLAETWEEDIDGEEIETGLLHEHCSDYEIPPNGVLMITAGVDVQDDRLELELVGWGKDMESWSLDYKVIHGSPASQDTWNALDDVLDKKYVTTSGFELGVACACVDSGGHHTEEVYQYCKKKHREIRHIFPIKGHSTQGKPIIGNPSKNNRQKVKMFMVGTDTAKDTLFAYLKLKEPGPGYCHFPSRYEDSYFEQLTAEKVVRRYQRGRTVRQYVKKSSGIRNEALDCRVYAMAAVKILNPDFAAIETRLNAQKKKRDATSGPNKSAVKKKHTARKSGGYVNNWRN